MSHFTPAFEKFFLKTEIGEQATSQHSFKQIKPISKKDENCNSVSVCCVVNSCGDKTDGLCGWWKEEPKSTAGASGRDEFGEREEKQRGESLVLHPVLKSQTENIPPKVNRR